jgi:metal-responsive CopG/Arc/MetJ family transcriptional regulator
MKTVVELPKNLVESLSEICQKEGISKTEAIRRALSRYLRDTKSNGKDAAFGLWRRKKINGLAYEDRIRREWER